MNWTNKLLIGAMVVLAGALAWVASDTLEPHVTNAGDTAPNFKVTADNGRTFTRSDFGGKLLILNFWASWCAPCVQEAPSMVAMEKELAPLGVVVLGVSQDSNEKRYKDFLQRFRVDFPTSRDPEANVAASYGTFLIPETYIIDKTGKVREKIISNQNWMDPAFLARVKSYL